MPTTLCIDSTISNRDALIRQTLDSWKASNEAFRLFTEKYAAKIRAKMRAAYGAEDQKDVLWELEVAYLILRNPDLTVEYESYGIPGTRSPDYRVTRSSGGQFNIEARRIRSASNEIRFEAWERRIATAIRATRSGLGVTLCFGFGVTDPKLLDRLESGFDEMIVFIPELLADMDIQLHRGQSRSVALKGFEEFLSLDLANE